MFIHWCGALEWNVLISRNVTLFEMGFPIEIGESVAPFLDILCRRESTSARTAKDATHTSICSGVQVSRSTLLTLLMWVPIPRWMPEQRMHRNTPLVKSIHYEAHEVGQKSVHIPTSPSRICYTFSSISFRTQEALTIAFAVCTDFVAWSPYKLAQDLGKALSRSLVLSGHRGGKKQKWLSIATPLIHFLRRFSLHRSCS